MKNQKTFIQLFIPIFIELLFGMMISFADTFMLSGIPNGDPKVAAVGTSSSFISIFTIAFYIVCSGMIAVMTQYIGAKKENVAQKALNIGLIINTVIGVIISIVFIFFTPQILTMMKVANGLKEDAIVYTQIIGGTSLITAITPIYSYYLRSFGHTVSPLIVTIISNVINIALNAIFLYVCKWEVFGVALATVISRLASLALLIVFANVFVKKDDRTCEISNRKLVAQIVRIGLPAALESTMYNLAMSFVMVFINMMDAEGVNAAIKAYCSQITSFCYMASMAMASANAVIVGWKIGEGKIEECYKITKKHCIIAIICGMSTALLITIIGRPLMHLFTSNEEIIAIAPVVFAINIALEFGRSTNLVMGQALKTSGDAVFTVVISILFTFVFAVGFTYIFGISLKMYIVGTWIGLALDEISRGICMLFRWKSKKWVSKIIVKNNKEVVGELGCEEE